MVAEIRRVLRTCEICQMTKAGGNKATKSNKGRPWQKVAVDLVGPLPETARGNKWILVVLDHFSRWQDALPLPEATAPVVATALDERIYSYLGLPEQLHSDQGAQFKSQFMSELCQLWRVDKTKTTSDPKPQANGVVERNNWGLGESL